MAALRQWLTPTAAEPGGSSTGGDAVEGAVATLLVAACQAELQGMGA